jgi:hypothetical protein
VFRVDIYSYVRIVRNMRWLMTKRRCCPLRLQRIAEATGMLGQPKLRSRPIILDRWPTLAFAHLALAHLALAHLALTHLAFDHLASPTRPLLEQIDLRVRQGQYGMTTWPAHGPQ